VLSVGLATLCAPRSGLLRPRAETGLPSRALLGAFELRDDDLGVVVGELCANFQMASQAFDVPAERAHEHVLLRLQLHQIGRADAKFPREAAPRRLIHEKLPHFGQIQPILFHAAERIGLPSVWPSFL
jgi:hypothetical protein